MTNRTASQQALALPQPKRVLLAFLLAPLAGPLGISIGISLPMAVENGSPMMLIGAAPLICLIATPVVYVFSIILGLPFFLLLHLSLGLSRAGLVLGWAAVGVISLMCLSGFTLPESRSDALIYLPFAMGGAAVGLSFWGILTLKPPPLRSTTKSQKQDAMSPDLLRSRSTSDSTDEK
jgi:hypothetical protein